MRLGGLDDAYDHSGGNYNRCLGVQHREATIVKPFDRYPSDDRLGGLPYYLSRHHRCRLACNPQRAI